MGNLKVRHAGCLMFDIMQDSVWRRATDLIKEKYGKSLSYRGIKLLSENGNPVMEQIYYSNGDDLIIPLRAKNHVLGDVIVNRGSLLDPQQKSEVVDLIKFLVEPKLYNIQLKKTEEALKNSALQGLKIVEDGESIDDLYVVDLEADQKRQTLSNIILLKSHTELNRNRVALKIHEMTERNLFVHLDDIIGTLKSPKDFAALSDITIYVSDVQKLSSATINLLKDYLIGATDGGPLFLIGSNLSMDGINEQSWPDSLKRDLAGFYFDIDRVPLAQQASEDILELLFFQFDSPLS
jgi:hypothetical protein